MKISHLFGYGFAALVVVSPFAQERAKYLDPNVQIEQRIDDLLQHMTIEEKASQVSDCWGSQGVPRLGVPSLLKTEGLHSQSYSTGATIFPQPISDLNAPSFNIYREGLPSIETWTRQVSI
jgi:hypothetical protein